MSNEIKERLDSIKDRIDSACNKSGRLESSVTLVAVTKTHSVEKVQALIDLGVRNIGENRTVEIEAKTPQLHGDFVMHMIGHLQTNKVAPILSLVKWVQSIDRERLVTRIENLYKDDQKLNCLVEVNTSGEESKSGCLPSECRALCERLLLSPALQLRGFMTIGPLYGGEKETRTAFSKLYKLAEQNRDLIKEPVVSMGMSGDFEWAIEEGSTMVRIGSLLLGER
jgi:pyridoxal phosphate enzyme (YggS family)